MIWIAFYLYVVGAVMTLVSIGITFAETPKSYSLTKAVVSALLWPVSVPVFLVLVVRS